MLNEILKKLVEEARKKDGRKPKNSLIIIDSQSVKNTDSAKKKATMLVKNLWNKAPHCLIPMDFLALLILQRQKKPIEMVQLR